MSKIMDELREEAAFEKAKEIAARLLETHLSVEEIAMHTCLSIEDVQRIKEERKE